MPHLRRRTTAGVPQARRLRSWVVNTVLVAFVAGLVYLFWPTSLGGCSTLTIVSGHSMEPTYFTGDLVWSRCGEAEVGDVVVYTPPGTGGAHVIHRIIGGNGIDGWVLQGDNNDFVDPWSPDDSLVAGVARLHVPGVGSIVHALASPYIWGSLLLIAAAIALWPPSSETEDDSKVDAETDPETESLSTEDLSPRP